MDPLHVYAFVEALKAGAKLRSGRRPAYSPKRSRREHRPSASAGRPIRSNGWFSLRPRHEKAG